MDGSILVEKNMVRASKHKNTHTHTHTHTHTQDGYETIKMMVYKAALTFFHSHMLRKQYLLLYFF